MHAFQDTAQSIAVLAVLIALAIAITSYLEPVRSWRRLPVFLTAVACVSAFWGLATGTSNPDDVVTAFLGAITSVTGP